MKVSLVPWTLRPRASRDAIRVHAVATAARLRTELLAVHATGDNYADPAWISTRDTVRATTAHLFTAIRRLPPIERRLVGRWHVAAGNTFWYMTGDRGYAPLEARAAELIAAVPDGLDVSAAVEVADEIDHRAERSVRTPTTAQKIRANRYMGDPEWADLIMTGPIPRRPVSFWWCLTRSDKLTSQRVRAIRCHRPRPAAR